VYNIHVYAYPIQMRKYDSYELEIEITKMDYEYHLIVNGLTKIHPIKEYDSYELATEVGLQEALKLITVE